MYAEDAGAFIWADNDLGAMSEAYEWCKEVDGLPIVPRTDVGLTRAGADVEEMQDHVGKRSPK
ncbi:MAG: hypothetical protein ACR2KK_01875 [Acidimicrobiales bacterium]